MTSLDISAPTFDLSISRGDTLAFTITFRDAESTNTPKDPLTLDVADGYTIQVDQLRNPPDATTNIFALAGTVLAQAGATLGQVQFNVSLANWTTLQGLVDAGTVVFIPDEDDNDNEYLELFLDIQQIDNSAANAVRSVGKGRFRVKQDINKATS